MLLTKPHVININMTKRCRDSLVLSNDKSNRLFIVAEDRL